MDFMSSVKQLISDKGQLYLSAVELYHKNPWKIKENKH